MPDYNRNGRNNTKRMSIAGQSDSFSTFANSSTSLAMKSSLSKMPSSQQLIQRRQSQVPVSSAGGPAVTPTPLTLRKSDSSRRRYVQLHYLVDNRTFADSLHNSGNLTDDLKCTAKRCCGSLMSAKAPPPVAERSAGAVSSTAPKPREVVLREAQDFLNQYYQSMKRQNSQAHQQRWTAVQAEIERRGTYDITEHELIYGAKLAWRNVERCIGRVQWSKLQVFDARFVTTPRGMFDAIINHIKYGTNKGNIRSAITVFQQRTDGLHDYRVWNPQLLRYAGYKQPDGSILGDPANVEFTEQCFKLGWKSPEPRTRFDILPLVLSANGRDPEVFNIPEDVVLEVALRHPDYAWFVDMGLKWYALPAVSGMLFDVGGIEFTACPFSGWYMCTEIGRDFCDEQRYNLLPDIAQRMGLDTSTSSTLWKDSAFVEVNRAILYSFQQDKVTIVDHHMASESFIKHFENESRARGGCPADWVWIVPPMSGSLTPVFHQEMLCYHLKPNYEYQQDAWRTHRWSSSSSSSFNSPSSAAGRGASHANKRKFGFREIARAVKFSAKLMSRALARRVKTTILFATETGRSERFARQLCDIFKHGFDVKVVCLSEYDPANLEHEQVVLIVTSTFGNGDPPENGVEFYDQLIQLAHNNNNNANSNNTTGHQDENRNNDKLLHSNNSSLALLPATNSHINKQSTASDLLGVDVLRRRRDSFSSVGSDGNSSRPGSSANFGATTGISSTSTVSSNIVNGDAFTRSTSPQQLDESGAMHSNAKRGSTTSGFGGGGIGDIVQGPLTNVYYSVFALGSTAYPKFCQFGKQLDRLLGKLGAERLLTVTCGDEMMGQDQTFKQWAPEVFKKACDTFCLTEDINMREADAAVMQGDSSWAPGRYRLRTGPAMRSDSVVEALGRLHRRAGRRGDGGGGIRLCQFVRKTYLQAPQSQRQTILVEINAATQQEQQNGGGVEEDVEEEEEEVDGVDGPPKTKKTKGAMSYEPGDHVGIFAENPTDIVDVVLDRLDFPIKSKLQYDQPYMLEHLVEKSSGGVKAWQRDERLPTCSLREAFTRYLDITTPPKQMLLERLTPFCSDPGDRERMERIAKSTEEYEVWKLYYWPHLADVLAQFTSLKIDPTLLLAQLPLLQPRFYSISSSPAVHSGQIHATVAVVHYRTQAGNGPEHHGLCSAYLERLRPGDTVPCFVRPAPTFRLPANRDAPVVMIGAGTGIAPFRSFWLHRDHELVAAAKSTATQNTPYMALYFGCRQAHVDDIYQQETRSMRERGVLHQVYVALSREPGFPKTYVQDLIMKNALEIYRILHELGGHIYVCGDVNMAAGVFDALKTVVTKHGGMSERSAKDYVKSLRDINRYHEDIFGTYIPSSEGKTNTT